MAASETVEQEEVASQAIRVLIVDNEKQHAYAMSESLERVGYECGVATSGPEGARLVEQETFDIVITDLVMNDVDGMEILKRAKETLPGCEVVVVTGHGTVPTAVDAMQQGAFNFLEKPITPNRLRTVTEKAAESVKLRRKNVELNQRLDEKFGFEKIVCASAPMKTLIDRLKRIAPTDAGVLITGENGTGKELVAQAIHQNSPRKGKPMVALNAGAIAENLVESELFGHVKGAFTDARADRMGRFEYANGGTILLDEIGDMPMSTQIKLLRVLEEHQITRVGDNKPVKVNVRVLASTNRDLEQAIKDGTFRQDLYFRLKIVTVHIPRLAERQDDIIPLADFFRRQAAKHHNKTVKTISPDVMRRFLTYDWPGNVRELRNVIENMIVLDIDGVLNNDDLPLDLADANEADLPGTGNSDSQLVGRTLDEIERWALEQTLKITNGNREETARILGIGARSVYRKIDKYGLS
ncbi:MAG: sigma-54-dependent Fis family transcriptional regulator [Planctomycetes bacterium]|nr:sigma-54-dependent Fis family transcriptional regulator [Planctomycetota bacterium]